MSHNILKSVIDNSIDGDYWRELGWRPEKKTSVPELPPNQYEWSE
jgi:hypothetical protein